MSVSTAIDGDVVAQLDAVVEGGAREIVLDISTATHADGEAVLFLAWLAHGLASAGGSLKVTARRPSDGARVTRTLRAGVLTCALGVHPVLDRAILQQLATGAGGATPR
jgi:hypothetical protein